MECWCFLHVHFLSASKGGGVMGFFEFIFLMVGVLKMSGIPSLSDYVNGNIPLYVRYFRSFNATHSDVYSELTCQLRAWWDTVPWPDWGGCWWPVLWSPCEAGSGYSCWSGCRSQTLHSPPPFSHNKQGTDAWPHLTRLNTSQINS